MRGALIDDTTRYDGGGSWISSPQFCRAAYRDNYGPTYRRYYLGFRLAL